jgi:DNA invertase Pin-like site-specific DNA recombinase
MRGRLKGAKKREAALKQALDLAAAGKTQQEIAKEIGVDQATVSRWMKRESDYAKPISDSSGDPAVGLC